MERWRAESRRRLRVVFCDELAGFRKLDRRDCPEVEELDLHDGSVPMETGTPDSPLGIDPELDRKQIGQMNRSRR
jgi:hypothetical protein